MYNSAGIKKASLYTHKRAFMLHSGPKRAVEFSLKILAQVCVIIEKWCLGPELNRHDPVKESQDFKSCDFLVVPSRKQGLAPLYLRLESFSKFRNSKSRHQNGISPYSLMLSHAPFFTILNSIKNSTSSSGELMGLPFTTRVDGTAVASCRTNLHYQLQLAGVHLQRYGKIHGTETAGYAKRERALEAAKNLYKGLCGDEKPTFNVPEVCHR